MAVRRGLAVRLGFLGSGTAFSRSLTDSVGAIDAPQVFKTTGSAWPNATNVGLLTTTTRTFAGASITTASWFSGNGFGGTGTKVDPYLVDRVLFTSGVIIGDWDPNNLQGKWIKFTNCRFYGDPGNPTQGGSACIASRTYSPFLIVEDSTLGPNATLQSDGGPDPAIGGMDKCLQANNQFEVRRCNLYGACIPVYFETERTSGVSFVQNNYVHDIWSSNGDHTDLVNGNLHASHIVVQGNYLDGIRTGGAYVVNAIGIYDDPSGTAGLITDWTIENNYFDRFGIGILSNTSSTRFSDPFVVRNNVFTNRFGVVRTACRTPSIQAGNVDQNGAPLTF